MEPKCRLEQTVAGTAAAQIGSGALPVFGTPFMAAMMENAAMTALQNYLTDSQGSVGIHLDISHEAPTPVGMKVWAEAEIYAVSENGKIVDFKVSLGRKGHHRPGHPLPGHHRQRPLLDQVQRQAGGADPSPAGQSKDARSNAFRVLFRHQNKGQLTALRHTGEGTQSLELLNMGLGELVARANSSMETKVLPLRFSTVSSAAASPRPWTEVNGGSDRLPSP